jgi:hypothetical protein
MNQSIKAVLLTTSLLVSVDAAATNYMLENEQQLTMRAHILNWEIDDISEKEESSAGEVNPSTTQELEDQVKQCISILRPSESEQEDEEDEGNNEVIKKQEDRRIVKIVKQQEIIKKMRHIISSIRNSDIKEMKMVMGVLSMDEENRKNFFEAFEKYGCSPQRIEYMISEYKGRSNPADDNDTDNNDINNFIIDDNNTYHEVQYRKYQNSSDIIMKDKVLKLKNLVYQWRKKFPSWGYLSRTERYLQQ